MHIRRNTRRNARYETEGEKPAVLAGVPSHPVPTSSSNRGRSTDFACSRPRETKTPERNPVCIEKEIRDLTVAKPGKVLAGKEQKPQVEAEVGFADIKEGGELSPVGEWIWMQDPWAGKWERLRIPKEGADYRKRREVSPRPSYWGETEVREWRRKLREEKEWVKRERRERIEWTDGDPDYGIPCRPWDPYDLQGTHLGEPQR